MMEAVFNKRFKLLLVPFCKFRFGCAVPEFDLNLFQKFRCDFTIDVNSFLDFESAAKETLAFGHVFDVNV